MPQSRRSLQVAFKLTQPFGRRQTRYCCCLEFNQTGGTFLKTRMIAMVLVCGSTMTGQIASYLGPGILTRGAGDIGTRAGQDVNLRFFVSASGIYDNGLQPYSVDGKGQLVTVNGLWGSEVGLGAYGVHNFRHGKLGLDYKGT